MADATIKPAPAPSGRKLDFSIALACDQGYAMPLATTLRSVVDSNTSNWPIDFHLLCEGFSAHLQHKVLTSLPAGSASIRWVQVDLGSFGEFFTASYISKMTYARLLIPMHFPSAVARVLYLDADLLVVGDLGPLLQADLEGAVLGAVPDAGLDEAMKRDLPLARGVPRVRDYLNAGVLLMDLQRWKKERISEKAIEYLQRNPQSPFADQDALNVACDGRWRQLDAHWNYQDHYQTRIADMNNADRPAIVHFVTNLKPWIPEVASPNARLYESFRRRTLFRRTPRERLTEGFRYGWARTKQLVKRLPGGGFASR